MSNSAEPPPRRSRTAPTGPTLSDLLARLSDVEETADGWLVHCPAHEDSQQSLRLAVSDAGRVLVRCRAGCDTSDVMAGLGLTMRDLATMRPGDVDASKRRATSTALPATPADVARLRVRLDGYAAALDGGSDGAADALGYLRQRFGLENREAIRALGLGYTDDLVGSPRLVVPFRDANGVARGFQARALDAEQAIRWTGPRSPEGGSWSKTGLFDTGSAWGEVLVCEGPGDALTAVGIGYAAVSIAGASHAGNPAVVAEVAAMVGGRTALIAGDGDEAGQRFAATLATALAAAGVATRLVDVPEGLDLTSWRARNPVSFSREVERAIAAARAAEPPPAPAKRKQVGTDRSSVVRAVLDRYEFARTPDGSVVTIPRDPAAPYVAEEVADLPAEIARMVWDAAGEALKPQEMSAAKQTVSALAAGAPLRPAPLRVFEGPDLLAIDLGRDDARVVQITADGWEVVEARASGLPAFRRTRASEPLPLPEEGASRDLFREMLGFPPNDSRWRLVWGWLVGSLFESSSRPVLWVSGPQGSGKSTRARMVKSVIDPALGPTGREGALGAAPTGDERDDTTSAAGQFVPSWDNISTVSTATSDWFCTLVTGASTVRRRLYTDGGMFVQRLRRTGVATSIAMPLGLRPDALERLVAVEFDRVPPSERRTEGSIWRDFRAMHPLILGALFDDVAGVLAQAHAAGAAGVELPRMADFAEHLIALDLHAGLDPAGPDGFFGAYISSVNEALRDRAGDEPLVRAVAALVHGRKGSRGVWEGSATDLQDAIADARPVEEWWPSGARALSVEVVKASESLRSIGVEVERVRSHGVRSFRLTDTRAGAATGAAAGAAKSATGAANNHTGAANGAATALLAAESRARVPQEIGSPVQSPIGGDNAPRLAGGPSLDVLQ